MLTKEEVDMALHDMMDCGMYAAPYTTILQTGSASEKQQLLWRLRLHKLECERKNEEAVNELLRSAKCVLKVVVDYLEHLVPEEHDDHAKDE